MTPLSYEPLDCAAGLSQQLCEEGIVGIAGKIMKIISTEKLGEMFSQQVFPLRYTPKKMVVNPLTNHLIIVESNHRSYNEKEKN